MLKQQLITCSDVCTTESSAVQLPIQPPSRRQKKKIVRKRSGDSNDSNDSRRSLNTSAKKIPDYTTENHPFSKALFSTVTESLEMTPKLKADRQTRDLLRDGYTFVRLNHSATLRKAAVDTSDFLKEQSLNRLPECIHQQTCSNRIGYLEEEVKMRNQEIELLEDERQKLKQLSREQQLRIKQLQEGNSSLQEELEHQREQIKKLGLEKKKQDSERQSLAKKIGFLEKINFSTETKNIQSFREEHLEKELMQCRERLAKQKSQTQRMLELELVRVKEELFASRKTVQSQQISNLCLQRKLEERAFFESNNEQYVTLRSKYRKFLLQFKDLRRDYEKLQQEHRRLQNQGAGNTDQTLSFDLSTL